MFRTEAYVYDEDYALHVAAVENISLLGLPEDGEFQ